MDIFHGLYVPITSTFSWRSFSHPKPTHRSSTRTLLGRLSLHFFADLQIDLEELAHASIKTNAFALVEVGFAVLGGYAFLCAGLGQSVQRFF